EATGTRITVIDLEGIVLIDTSEDPAVMENHASRPEIHLARETGEASNSVRQSRTLGHDRMYMAVPVVSGGRAVGIVRTSLPLIEVEESRARLRVHVATGGVLAAALALLMAFFFSRRFSARIGEMTKTAEAIAAGDYRAGRKDRGRDELATLAGAVDRMSDQLRERMDTLVRERNELRAILGSMLEGVVAVDREERIFHLNRIAAEILSTRAEDAIGGRIWEIARIQPLAETIAGVLEDETGHTREARITDGSRDRILELIASPLRDIRGDLVGAVLVLHDVTELRRLELIRRDFVVNVSHELKTPLTAIRGFVETLIDDPEIDRETAAGFLGRVNDQVLRLSTLVTDLLVLSRVESEGEALERRPVDLRGILRECAGRLSPESRGRDIEFVLELPKGDVTILGDDESLRQVVDNLLDNALKYTPDGGRVDLRLLRAGDEVAIEVEDTGIGIDGRHVDRIFERFYRVDKARSRELGGTGLGLSIVKHITNAHGGRVAVVSETGRGSTFRVSLPAHEVRD
ncbi:MAG: ATP-binding protein, partial [Planctomycetota bacterium]